MEKGRKQTLIDGSEWEAVCARAYYHRGRKEIAYVKRKMNNIMTQKEIEADIRKRPSMDAISSILRGVLFDESEPFQSSVTRYYQYH